MAVSNPKEIDVPNTKLKYFARVECTRLNRDVDVKVFYKWTTHTQPEAVERALWRAAIARLKPKVGEYVTLLGYGLAYED